MHHNKEGDAPRTISSSGTRTVMTASVDRPLIAGPEVKALCVGLWPTKVRPSSFPLNLPIDDNPDSAADRKQVLFFTKEQTLRSDADLRCRCQDLTTHRLPGRGRPSIRAERRPSRIGTMLQPSVSRSYCLTKPVGQSRADHTNSGATRPSAATRKAPARCVQTRQSRRRSLWSRWP